MKAFLSHATVDKGFVEPVAKYLGREYIVYDVYSFDHGENFKTAISRGLGKSNIFVFFVSRASLKSVYCDLELDEAQRKLFDQDIAKAIAIRLDNTIRFDELPHWLRRINAPFMQSPLIAARLIKEHVNELKRAATPDLLIGRTQEIARVEQALTPRDHRPPGIIVLWGLPGIGRRAIAKRVLRDILDFQRPLVLTIESGDNIADIRLKLEAHFEPLTDSASYRALQEHVERSSRDDNITECLALFEKAQAGRELVLLLDQGGLLDDEGGDLLPDFSALILEIFASNTLRCIIVSRRRPAPLELEKGLSLPNVRIDSLSNDSTRTLLHQLSSREEVALSPQEVGLLADRVRGYPPAAYYAIGLIKDYGRELILRDARQLISFRESSFIHLLQKDHKFTETQQRILGILPNFESLPLSVLGQVLKIDQQTIDRDAMRLIDLALLTIDRDGFYAVADPVREVAHKVFGRLDERYEDVATAIDRYLDELQIDKDASGVPLSLVRARYKSYVLAGRDRKGLFRMASDLIDLQQTLYHDQDYDRSIEVGRQALEIRKGQLDALKYIARAETQLERYPDAKATIELIKAASSKEAAFLEGFLMRKSGRPRAAVAAYERAIALGMKGVAVHRELGQCLFLTSDFPAARDHLGKARTADPTNKFVLDFDIQVAIAEERFDDARKSIPELEQVEDEFRVQHRLSTLESAIGNYNEAFLAAKQAVNAVGRPHFEVITQYISTAIRTKRLDEALRGFEMLAQRFPKIRKDIQNGLWARFHLAKGEIDEASTFWSKIADKGSDIHRRIREEILDLTLRKRALSPEERRKLQAELDTLRSTPRRKGVEALEAELS